MESGSWFGCVVDTKCGFGRGALLVGFVSLCVGDLDLGFGTEE